MAASGAGFGAWLLGAEFGTVADRVAAVGTIAAVGSAVTEIRRADRDGEEKRADADVRLQRQLEHSRSSMERESQLRIEAEDRRWLVDHLLELLHWWSRYSKLQEVGMWTNRGEVLETLEKRAQARTLISALPSEYARIAAVQGGVGRRPYPATQAGAEQVMDGPRIREINSARLEIEWDLQSVHGTNNADSATAIFFGGWGSTTPNLEMGDDESGLDKDSGA